LHHQLFDYHSGEITGMDTLPHQHQCVTVGSDGTMRIWNFEEADRLNPLMSKMSFETPLSCVACNRTTNLIAIGSIHGFLRIVEAHDRYCLL
jgi:WD40 repeat protein